MVSSASQATLRKTLRSQRRNLTKQQQQLASLKVCRHLIQLPAFLRSQRLAVYLSNDGEVNLAPLFHYSWQMGKELYLPVLHPLNPGELVFMKYVAQQTLAKNRYGIPEPIGDPKGRCPNWMLDLVLTPLVGFDKNGNRIGMGGGYYDRSFAFKNTSWRARKPLLIGTAHECQKITTTETGEGLATNPWDVAMDAVITDTRVYPAPD